MIPSPGLIYCVSHLTNVAELNERRSLSEWVHAAREHGGYLAAANDLDARAEFMVEKGLATVGDVVYISPRLGAINALPRESAEYQLARMILLFDPPPWLGVAVDGRRVERAYIPVHDLEYLSWVEPRLDELLCDVFRELQPETSGIEDELGLAAELVVMGALQQAGFKPVHVALISDAYGYDVEVRHNTVERIEVKAAASGTAGSFHLSRNEYEKCLQHNNEWRLVQVVFSTAAFVASRLDLTHIEEINQVSAAEVRSLVPHDTSGFRWEESALITPPGQTWRRWVMRPNPDFSIGGFA